MPFRFISFAVFLMASQVGRAFSAATGDIHPNAVTYTITERPSVSGLWAQVHQVLDGATITYITSGRYGETNGLRLAYWTVNGQRPADALGRAHDPAVVVLQDTVPVYDIVAMYTNASIDTDADQVPDWYEGNYFGNLGQAGASDDDSDGWSLMQEAHHDTHPGLSNEVVRAELGESGSAPLWPAPLITGFYHQESSPTGLIATTVAVYPVGTALSPNAPLTNGNLRFVQWSLNGSRQTNSLGAAANPAPFVLTTDVVAVASYLPKSTDSDGDAVPDWFELFYYGNLNTPNTGDTDTDGYGLYEEWYRNYNPLIADPLVYRVVERPSVTGAWALVEGYLSGTTVTYRTESRYGETNGLRLVCWTVNAVRPADALGRAHDPAVVVLQDTVPVYDIVAVYTNATTDTDTDQVPDWYEGNYFGGLAQVGASDSDTDGWSLVQEARHDTHPGLSNEVIRAELGESGSAPLWPDPLLTGFYRQESSPTGLVATTVAVYPLGTALAPSAPLTNGNFRFVQWALNGARQTNTLGAAANPAPFVLNTDVVAVASYLPQSTDTDGDTVADWYELFYYGNLNTPNNTDTDADSYTLYEEWYRGYNPLIADPLVYRILERPSVTGVWTKIEGYLDGTTVTYRSASRYGETNGLRLACWTVNGQRPADALGRAHDPAVVVLQDTVPVYDIVAMYTNASIDTDADQVPDWYEGNYFGDLGQAGASDDDSDVWSLIQEARHDTHPRLSNEVVRAELGESGSAPLWPDPLIAGFFRQESSPTGLIATTVAVYPMGTALAPSAPLTNGTLRFVQWSLNGARQTNNLGAAVNPAPFALTTDVVAIASYVPQSTDTDGDTVADWYELFYYGATNAPASTDTDGDGMDLTDEFQADTDPTDPLSELRITSSSSVAGGNAVSWIGGRDSVQVLQRGYDLSTNTVLWDTIYTVLPPTAYSTNVVDYTNMTHVLFYRIQSHRP